jgi:predicted permease
MARPSLPFRALMLLYPASFRREYADDIWRVHRDRRAATAGAFAVAALWLALAADTVANAARTHADILGQDLRYALRTLGRAPGFTATALLVAALGIGANAAAFSLADYVLLRPLPFADAERLVFIWQGERLGGQHEVAAINFRDWKAAARSFDGMAASWIVSANLVGSGEPSRLEGAAVSADLLPLLGVQPALGRGFGDGDDRDGAPGTVILSWTLWNDAFGGDRDVLGKTVTLDGAPFTVIGVMPRSFAFPTRETQFWRPLQLSPGAFDDPDRSDTRLRLVARLKKTTSLAQARAELAVVGDNLARAFPAARDNTHAVVIRLRDQVSEQSRELVLALVGAAACVLLIACLNLANLLLARALARRKELALRAALGAGRERIARQLLTESLLLALAGGALGVLLAALAMPLLTHLVPAALPISATPAIDRRVVAVAALLTLASALAFGVVPSLRAVRDIDAEGLREGARGAIGGRARLVRAVVVLEVAASLALLVCGGLLLRTLETVQRRDPGFHAGHVLTLRTWLPWPKYEKTGDRAQFYDRVLSSARALPGVSNAAYISFLPMAMGGGIWKVEIPGSPDDGHTSRAVGLRYVTPALFATLEVPLLQGRDVRESDSADRPFVAVVSESFVRRHWPGQNPLGKKFSVAFSERTVIGVVGDVRTRGPERESEPQVYLPYKQVPDGYLTFFTPKDLVLRSSLDAAALMPALRDIVRRVDPEQPISDVRTLDEIVARQTAPRRVQIYVLGTFAVLAFLLAGIGVYGLLSFAVSNRARDIGVRMALGATPRAILGMVLGEGVVLAALGAVLGVVVAWWAAQSLQALLVGVAPGDVPTFAAALALVILMALAGSAIPAWRATRVDPAIVIRGE